MEDSKKTTARRALDIASRAASIGFDWNDPHDVLDKIREELDEIRDALDHDASREHLIEEVGDLYFALVNFNRKMQIDSDEAFLVGVNKFERRFRALEKIIHDNGKSPDQLSQDELEDVWRRVKKEESNAH